MPSVSCHSFTCTAFAQPESAQGCLSDSRAFPFFAPLMRASHDADHCDRAPSLQGLATSAFGCAGRLSRIGSGVRFRARFVDEQLVGAASSSRTFGVRGASRATVGGSQPRHAFRQQEDIGRLKGHLVASCPMARPASSLPGPPRHRASAPAKARLLDERLSVDRDRNTEERRLSEKCLSTRRGATHGLPFWQESHADGPGVVR